MTARNKVRNIALSQLSLSPTNVRKTPATSAEDMALEASIRARGILQNLIVHPTPIDGKGVYEVDAGGRRLKILQKLAAEGVIDADHPVPCKIEDTGRRGRNLACRKHDPRRDAPGGRICGHGGADRRRRYDRRGRDPLRHLRTACPAAAAPRQARSRTARRLPLRRHQPRCRHRLHPRRRSRRPARGVEPAQGTLLHPALHGEASADRKRRAARFRSWPVRRRRGL